GAGEVEARPDRGFRAKEHVPGDRERAPGTRRDAAELVHEPAGDAGWGVRLARSRRLVRGRLGAVAVEDVEELDAGGAVQERVVQLERVSRASIWKALDQDGLPQRARAVERRHREDLRALEHGVEPAFP